MECVMLFFNVVIFLYLYCAIAVSALPKRFTTVSNIRISFLICSNTIWNPYRYTEVCCVDALLPGCGAGALEGSASTSFLRIAVAGRQTLTSDCGDDNICTTLRMNVSSKVSQPYSSSMRFCNAVKAYYFTVKCLLKWKAIHVQRAYFPLCCLSHPQAHLDHCESETQLQMLLPVTQTVISST